MNKYYGYPNIELWQTDLWKDKVAPLGYLIQHMQENAVITPSDYEPTYEYSGDLHDHPLFRKKTHGIDDPGIVSELNKKGISYLCTGQGGGGNVYEHCWICLCPQKAIDDWTKLPVYMYFGCEDEDDPRWTMRALKRHWDKVEMLERSMDFILVILVDQYPSYDRIYFGIMQEFSILFPCDINRMYVDVTPIYAMGKQLKDVPNFEITGDDGNKLDPDAKVEPFGDLKLPVLNVKGLWGNCDSLERGLVVTYGINEGRFNREWLIHSEVGKRMAQDMLYEYKYDCINDPAFLKEMEDKGLVYSIRFNELGERYVIACPRQQYEEKTEIPVVLVLQEVYEGNEHLAVTAHSYLAEWLEIAAQGECCLIYYVLEDIVSNDRAIDIVKTSAEEFNLDLGRVYLTGHSHDGYFAYAMANRNPGFAAALATLGMGCCPVGMNDVPDYSTNHPIADFDMPTINITGVCESNFPKSEADKNGRWVDSWKQTMRNYRLPVKSTEEILAAFDSRNYAQKITCIPADSFMTVWADGFEHYIADFVNVDGKNHLRCVRQQNMPHTVTPFMCTLSWDFMRRFRRDLETGEIVELY